MRCGNCNWADRVQCLGASPKNKCVITSKHHFDDDECDIEFVNESTHPVIKRFWMNNENQVIREWTAYEYINIHPTQLLQCKNENGDVVVLHCFEFQVPNDEEILFEVTNYETK